MHLDRNESLIFSWQLPVYRSLSHALSCIVFSTAFGSCPEMKYYPTFTCYTWKEGPAVLRGLSALSRVTHTHTPPPRMAVLLLPGLGSFSSQPGGLHPPPPPRLLNTAEDGNFLIIPDRLPGTSVGELGRPAGGDTQNSLGASPKTPPPGNPLVCGPSEGALTICPCTQSQGHSQQLPASFSRSSPSWMMGGRGLRGGKSTNGCGLFFWGIPPLPPWPFTAIKICLVSVKLGSHCHLSLRVIRALFPFKSC